MDPTPSTQLRPQSLRIASPCLEDWNAMAGNNRVRFCGSCKQNVYNVTDLGPHDVQALLLAHEGRLCMRMRVRPDGTLVRKDCRARLRALRTKGALGWLVFLILIVPATLASHLWQVSWLRGGSVPSSMGAPSLQGEIRAAPAEQPPGILMGKPLMRDPNTPY